MKKLLNLTALLSILGLSALMTGCGDDDDGGGGGLALANILGQQITLTPAGGQPQRYTFTTQGNNFTLFDANNNVVVTGTYVYNPSNNTAVLTTTDVGGASQVINLAFGTANSGAYSIAGTNISGTFAVQHAPVNPP